MTRRFLSSALGVFGLDQLRHVAGQLGLRQRDVAVIVEVDAFEVLCRHELGQTFGQHDHAELLAVVLAGDHHVDDHVDDGIDVHDSPRARSPVLGSVMRFRGLEVVDQVLDAQDQAGLAGDGRAVGQPAGASAHGFDQEVHPAGLGVGQQVADLARQGLDGREVAEREVDAAVVVVDRLGNVDDRDPPFAGRKIFLEPLELVGRLERVVAADRDQCIDAQRRKRAMDRAELGGPLRDRRGAPARTRPCRGWCARFRSRCRECCGCASRFV